MSPLTGALLYLAGAFTAMVFLGFGVWCAAKVERRLAAPDWVVVSTSAVMLTVATALALVSSGLLVDALGRVAG